MPFKNWGWGEYMLIFVYGILTLCYKSIHEHVFRSIYHFSLLKHIKASDSVINVGKTSWLFWSLSYPSEYSDYKSLSDGGSEGELIRKVCEDSFISNGN